jgi:hypothetical protein
MERNARRNTASPVRSNRPISHRHLRWHLNERQRLRTKRAVPNGRNWAFCCQTASRCVMAGFGGAAVQSSIGERRILGRKPSCATTGLRRQLPWIDRLKPVSQQSAQFRPRLRAPATA